ncbi:Ribonuclease H [Handroanthus impetiginosus]|uniref:Ribonuclease H n=1 Tax=Handroanthus impetiginosus TaxID=429701 RepID=A0A2G9G8U7_9LAMI|nr:Ribonuclease H [Handroanthus impetiginosus]
MKVDVDIKPFTDAELYFADTKLYLDPDSVKEVLPLKIASNHPIEEGQVELKIVYEEFKGVFDPKSYKLLEKSDFDFASPPSLGKLQSELTGEKIHGLTKKQQELRKQWFYVEQPKVGLGYVPTKPVIIHITKKDKCVNVQHITSEDDTKDKGKQSDERVSIFNRLGSQTSRPSVFERLGTPNQMPMFKNKLATHRRSTQKKQSDDGKIYVAKVENEEQILHLTQPSQSKTQLISRADPVKFVMSKPVLSWRLAKWSIIFNQYEITYISQKVVKGQALANFLADHPIPAEWELSDEFSDEDALFIEILPQVLTYSIVLNELCFNNVAEFQALIIGLQMAQEMGIAELEVYGDSKLVINQLLNVYEQASSLLRKFEDIVLRHVPRKENRLANALANLATTLALLEGKTTNVPVCHRWILPSLTEFDYEDTNAMSVSVSNDKDWRIPQIDYLIEGKLPQDPRHRTEVRRRASYFILYKDTLYRRSFEGNYQRCLND